MTQAQKVQQSIAANHTITLTYPVRLATGQELTSITLRRPCVGDLRAVAQFGSDVEQEIALFSRLAGLVPEDIDLLDFADYQAIQDWFRTLQGKDDHAATGKNV
ncbi:phage tail assembly protein [Kingella denitrificans]